VSGDLLDGGRPKRLVLRQGRWFLEISRLVSTGDGVFQPRSTRIEGKPAIVEALRRSKHGKALADGAAKLVANGASAPDQSFDAIDGAWVPSHAGPSTAKQLAPGDARTPLEAALLAELTMLRASHEGLASRVARLERLLARKLDGEPVAVKRDRAEPRAAVATSPHADTASAVDEPPQHASGEAPQEPGAETRPSGAIEFPVLGLVIDALKQLCGHEVPLKEMKNAPSSWLASPERFYASWLADEAGDVQGGIVCDGEAVARLGGAYLAMPQADIEAHAASAELGEDIVSAASDICGTIAGLVNDLRDNPRIRSTPLARYVDGAPAWVESPTVCIVCVHPGGGTVAFVSR
jgi:hypothetical protein